VLKAQNNALEHSALEFMPACRQAGDLLVEFKEGLARRAQGFFFVRLLE